MDLLIINPEKMHCECPLNGDPCCLCKIFECQEKSDLARRHEAEQAQAEAGPRGWVEAHKSLGHEAIVSTFGAPGYGNGSWCATCELHGPSNGGIFTLADVE